MLIKDEGKARALVTQIRDTYRAKGWTIACAESCTGGLTSALLTAVPGSSDVFDRGFITYTNAAKHDMLGVEKQTLDTYGAVSEETAKEMATGALKTAHVDVAVSITGIAGPGGGSVKKPVGLVCFGLATRDKSHAQAIFFEDKGRDAIREASALKALSLFLSV